MESFPHPLCQSVNSSHWHTVLLAKIGDDKRLFMPLPLHTVVVLVNVDHLNVFYRHTMLHTHTQRTLCHFQ